MASSIPAARTYLYELVDALTAEGEALEGVGVYRTGLWREAAPRDRVMLMNAIDIRRDWGHIGRRSMDENYAIQIDVQVYRSGSDLETIEDRLWAIATAIERAIVEDYTLGGTVRRATPAGAPGGATAGPTQEDNDVLMAQSTLRIDCFAQVNYLA
jgi:hypothetical protein